MPITSHLFEAYLKCQTKCFLRSLGKTANGNGYSDWVQAQQASYRSEGIKRLTLETAQNECVTNPIDREDAQSAKWRFAVEITARAQNLESTIHAVEHLTSEERDKLGLFIPIRFIFTNKLHKEAKLLLAFDAFVLSEHRGTSILACAREQVFRLPVVAAIIRRRSVALERSREVVLALRVCTSDLVVALGLSASVLEIILAKPLFNDSMARGGRSSAFCSLRG